GATVVVAPDGDFVVAWNEDGAKPECEQTALQGASRRATPAEIIAQRFSSAGDAIGGAFHVNRHKEGRQALSIAASGRQAAWSGRGQLAFVWSGDTGQDDNRGVALSLFVPKDLVAPEPMAVAQMPAGRDVLLEDVYPQIPPVFDPDFVPEPPEVAFPLRDGDFGFLGIQATGWTPPDPEIAAGPDYVVLVVNGQICFRNHAGTATFSQAIAGIHGFWGSVGATSFVFDPVALYDVHSQRFIVLAAELWNDNANSALNLAVSDDSDPNGTWYKYRFEVSSYGGFLDFPNLGVDANAIYVAADFFGASGNPTTGNYIFVIPKAPTLTGAPASISGVRTATSPRSLGNCKNYDATAPAQYFPGVGGSNTIRLHAITNPLGTPSLSTYNLTVSSFSYPPDASQLGTSNQADTVDWRIKNSVYRNGSLWICHTIGQSSTARVRWYEVNMRGWPTSGLSPQLAQSGTLNYGTGEHTWFPDIHVDDYGNAILGFNRSSSTQYISIQRAIRRSSDAAGTFQAPVTLQVSTSPEEGDRWGDYSGVDEQPNQPGVFWTHAEYRTSNWRTWVGKVLIGDCNGNGVPDEVDISSGTSLDCNGNLVPDECDISDGTSADCNGNGVPDECDVAGGFRPDGNGNGVPDECEVDVLYVDAGAVGAATGLTWSDAYVELQDALAVGRGTGSAVQEIWVAAGTYTPDRGTGDRAVSFELPGGVAVYGGFAGGEMSFDQRDISANTNVLSGDIGVPGDISDNSYHVLRNTDTGATAVLDGFVVTAGNATGTNPADVGGGLYNTGDALFRHCTFRSNRAAGNGGAISNQGGQSLTLLNCEISGNHAASRGGGVQTYQSDLTAVNCTFANNTAGAEGGGVFMNTVSTSLTNCIVWGNTAMGGVSDESAQIHVLAGNLAVDYSCVEHWSGTFGGTGNNGLHPLFVDADGADNVIGTADDNLRLLPGSGAIDGGNNAAVPTGVTTDLAGGPRFIDDPATPDGGSGVPPIVDMGAYEYSPVADFDGDLDIDLVDFAGFQVCMNQPATGACVPGDLTRDGQVDELDIGPFASVLTGP
ncbi:MAG: right-handed parallel beta-helix repeat-containing protein, partial [Phycisphaerae bacterium]|nr:right-handed parallel beta-helix repeat-containing protein [Phycisphaerae bacterium]